jgi:hypothetical protein
VAYIIGYTKYGIHEHMDNNDQLSDSRAYEHQVLTHAVVKSIHRVTVRNLKYVIPTSAYIDQDR